MQKIILDGNSLTLKKAFSVIYDNVPIELDEESLKKVEACSEKVKEFVNNGEIVYGITTGFGSLKNVAVPKNKTEELQRHLLRSHAAGWGEPLSFEVARGMLLLRLNAMLKGNSGVKKETVFLMRDLINLGLYPYIPSRGSVGASGDLAPLAHMALCLNGEGEFIVDGKRESASSVLSKNGLKPLVLAAKEGLALINGTQMMTSIAIKLIKELGELINISALACSLSLEALMGTRTAFRHEIQDIRPHIGQKKIAELIYNITDGSDIISSHTSCDRVQDPYSLRCIPQVLGAVIDTWEHAKSVVSIELNSVTDNPVIVNENEVLSAGNFHGEPIAFILDFLSIAMTKMANISERRLERMTNNQLSPHLPAFLVKDSGVNSGFMIVQYLAASLVSECKALSHPGSVDSIPTSSNQEDHVSMGPVAGFKALNILEYLKTVITIELMVGAQATDFINSDSSPILSKLRKEIRNVVSFMEHDRIISKDIEKLRSFVVSGKLLNIITGGGLSIIE